MLNIFNDFLNLIYPNVCIICDEKLVFGEQMFCANCLSDIPKTNYIDVVDNPVARLFWGRVKLEGAVSFFHYNTGSRYRKLLHKLKYKGQKEIGTELGKMLGAYLLNTPLSTIDVVLPVPLHSKRFRSRGYNQSEYIGKGISHVMNKPLLNDVLVRKVFHVSQTKMGRYERWENVEGIFHVKDPLEIVNKHILLVDDIITTGSTLEACVTSMINVVGCQVSICTLAITS